MTDSFDIGACASCCNSPPFITLNELNNFFISKIPNNKHKIKAFNYALKQIFDRKYAFIFKEFTSEFQFYHFDGILTMQAAFIFAILIDLQEHGYQFYFATKHGFITFIGTKLCYTRSNKHEIYLNVEKQLIDENDNIIDLDDGFDYFQYLVHFQYVQALYIAKQSNVIIRNCPLSAPDNTQLLQWFLDENMKQEHQGHNPFRLFPAKKK